MIQYFGKAEKHFSAFLIYIHSILLNYFPVLPNPVWHQHPSVKIKAVTSAVDDFQAACRIGVTWAQIPPSSALKDPALEVIGADPALVCPEPPL